MTLDSYLLGLLANVACIHWNGTHWGLLYRANTHTLKLKSVQKWTTLCRTCSKGLVASTLKSEYIWIHSNVFKRVYCHCTYSVIFPGDCPWVLAGFKYQNKLQGCAIQDLINGEIMFLFWSDHRMYLSLTALWKGHLWRNSVFYFDLEQPIE